jgi:hypothetical protein
MDLEARYLKILAELDKGHRGLERFSEDEVKEIQSKIGSALKKKNFSELEKYLCLIDHSASNLPQLEDDLILLLNSDLPTHIKIFTLDASRKHIINSRVQRGQRLTFEFLEALKNNLYSKDPELVEWTLRTIEESGNQGVYFLRDFDKIRPAPWRWFNAHQRAVVEIITMLERRWRRFEKP